MVTQPVQESGKVRLDPALLKCAGGNLNIRSRDLDVRHTHSRAWANHYAVMTTHHHSVLTHTDLGNLHIEVRHPGIIGEHLHVPELLPFRQSFEARALGFDPRLSCHDP